MDKELIGGSVVDVYHWPVCWQSPHPEEEGKEGEGAEVVDIILFPGNPGLLFFYLPFLEGIGKALGAHRCAVHGFGLLGHHLSTEGDAGEVDEGKDLGLNAQCSHAYNCVRSISATRGKNVKLVLIGHSIGSYLVLDMLQKHLELTSHLRKVIHLMPFIRWDNIPLVHKFKLTLYTYFESTVNSLVHFLTERLLRLPLNDRERLIRHVGGLNEADTDDVLPLLAGRLLSARLVRNFFLMGRDEIEAVPREQARMMEMVKALDGLCPQLIVITDNDEWSPEDGVAYYRSAYPNSRVVFLPSVKHGFTFSFNSSAAVAKVISDFFLNANSVRLSKL